MDNPSHGGKHCCSWTAEHMCTNTPCFDSERLTESVARHSRGVLLVLIYRVVNGVEV